MSGLVNQIEVTTHLPLSCCWSEGVSQNTCIIDCLSSFASMAVKLTRELGCRPQVGRQPAFTTKPNYLRIHFKTLPVML